jgi:hypothetical protein
MSRRRMGDSRFDHNIVPGSVSVRPCLAVAGYTGIDYTWVELRDCVVVHGILCEGAGKVVLHEYITFFD